LKYIELGGEKTRLVFTNYLDFLFGLVRKYDKEKLNLLQRIEHYFMGKYW